MKRVVKDLMIDKFVTLHEKDLIYEAVEKIAKNRETMIGCVVDEEKRLKGLITPKDLLRVLEVRGYGTIEHPFSAGPGVLHLLTSEYARDIMCAPVSVRKNDEVHKAIDIMLDEGFYEVPVVDEEGRVIGVINYFDIIISSIDQLKRE